MRETDVRGKGECVEGGEKRAGEVNKVLAPHSQSRPPHCCGSALLWTDALLHTPAQIWPVRKWRKYDLCHRCLSVP